ncbi:MFS transporter [Pseudomonas sp. KU26590]|uniref:MDR family MFS transporter n=1 Tax=Pseudomonas sp. KU26590 TaxID=2991051 RepID=UPI00223D908E|nr:MDR family MFS transporter [Pseudomonas sp. KU26590]UZJ57944.1 MFS transporter [Pseudomonas sp. KU26590]
MLISQSQETEAQPVGLIITAIALTLFLSSLSQTIVSIALPTIVADLGGVDQLTLVIIAYLVSSTVAAPLYGKFGDLYGRKIVLQVAIVIFLAGSGLCAAASSMPFLVVARVVQGLGGGGLMVVAMTVVADIIAPRQRGKVQGILGAVFGLATAAGPLLGGVLVDRLGWHWIFLLNLPLGLLALGVITLALKPRSESKKQSIDYAGIILLTAALASFVIATSLGGKVAPWISFEVLGLLTATVVLTAVFIAVEARSAEPLLPLRLFESKTFVLTSSIGALVAMGMFCCTTFIPLYLQTVKGVSPTQSGLQLLPMMGGMIVSATLSGWLVTKTGRYKYLPVVATAVMAAGLLCLGLMQLDTPTWRVAVYLTMVGAGIGPVQSVGITATQNAVEGAMVGIATASSSMFRQIGGSLGVSVFGAVFATGLASGLSAIAATGVHVSAFSLNAIASAPDTVRQSMLSAFANALHPVFLGAAAAAVMAFVLSLFLEELPLGSSLHRQP